jgi:hypothetical protein
VLRHVYLPLMRPSLVVATGFAARADLAFAALAAPQRLGAAAELETSSARHAAG